MPKVGWFRRAAARAADIAAMLWFSARVSLGWQSAVAVGGAVLVFTVAVLGGYAWSERHIFRLLAGLESLLFVILSMGLFPREREEKTLEVLLSCARSRNGLLLLKFVPVCLFVAAEALALATGFYAVVGGFSWLKMFFIPYEIGAAVGILTVALSTYFRSQYAAGAVAILVSLAIAILWFDPYETFYTSHISRMMRDRPNLLLNRVILAVVFGFLYDHALRRLRRLELWMR